MQCAIAVCFILLQVDKHIRKLDFDLARFEADLKEQHEQELAASDEGG